MRLVLLLATLLLPALGLPARAQAPADAPCPLLDRVVVLGASVSGGYGLAPELEATARLGDVLECVLAPGTRALTDLGDTYLFLSPSERGWQHVDEALARRPTLVVAVDFLFWFGYTSWDASFSRLDDLEAGLALLDRFDCPLVVGDFPDMAPALGGKGPLGLPLIVPHMIPSAQERARLNARVAEWAAARGDVVIVSMASMVQDMLSGRELVVHGNVWPAGGIDRLLQEDLLHPNVEGVIALSLAIVDGLVAAHPDCALPQPTWDAQKVRTRLLEATRAEREKRLERERRWAEFRARQAQKSPARQR